jgi:hypothetical protein
MAVTTTLTPFNIGPAMVTKKFFLVDNTDDAQALEKKGQGGFIAALSDGKGVHEWTAAKGLGGWEDQQYVISNATVFVTFKPFTMAQKKTKGYLKELVASLGSLNAGMTIIDIPAGSSIEDMMKKQDITFIMDDAKKAAATAVQPGTADADIMFGIAQDNFLFCRTPEGEHFLLPTKQAVYAWMVGSEKFRLFLIREFKKRTGSVPAPTAWAAAIDAVRAECDISDNVKDLAIRSARNGEDYWLDLGTESGQAICYNAAGWATWSAVPFDLPFAFRRTSAVLPLPVPEKIDEKDTKVTLQKLMKTFVNVSDDEWPLLVSYMVTHILPGFKTPIMLLTSEAQSGKSTATMAVRFAVEGNLGRGEKLPSKEDDIAVTMSQENMTMYNNVSNISHDLSDFLCQVVDGARYAKRKLRTDSEVVNLTLDSSLLMNGITTGELRSDFKTRTVRLNLLPLSETGGITDGEIDRMLLDAHPQILGCILTLAVGSLKRIPALGEFPRSFRMLDYTRVASTVDAMWGMEGRSIAKYKASLDEMSAEGLDDPLFETIRRMVVRFENRTDVFNTEFTATIGVKDIIMQYKSNRFTDAMDSMIGEKKRSIATGQKLAAELVRAKTDWKRHGITFEKLGQIRHNGVKDTFYTFSFKVIEGQLTWDNEPSQLQAHMAAV